jgi:hypothetical protein
MNDPIFVVTTDHGEQHRGYIEEADAANGVWLSGGEDGGPVLFDWDEISSLTKEEN